MQMLMPCIILPLPLSTTRRHSTGHCHCIKGEMLLLQMLLLPPNIVLQRLD